MISFGPTEEQEVVRETLRGFADEALRPNMVRFQIIYDKSHPFFSDVVGVTDVFIRVQPD